MMKATHSASRTRSHGTHARTHHRSMEEGTTMEHIEHQEQNLGHHRVRKPLNFNKAMSDFKTMFPHIDREVIETVLRANDGVVQATIDQLLVLSETAEKIDNDRSEGPRLPSYHEIDKPEFHEEPPPAYSEIEASIPQSILDGKDIHADSGNEVGVLSSGARTRQKYWNPPLLGTLPEDFLRLTANVGDHSNKDSYRGVSNSTDAQLHSDGFHTDRELEQFLEDEKLAMFLQNEEFVRELRSNREFVTSLEEDHRKFVQSQQALNEIGDDDNTPYTSSVSPNAGASSRASSAIDVGHGGARRRQPSAHEEVAFKNKLRHMGKSTRKKFGKLAKKFHKKKPAKPSYTLHSESTTNLLEEDEEDGENDRTNLEGIDEYEDDDEEEIQTETKPEKTGRRLPQIPPTVNRTGNEEPIVFYSEDNEFSFKSEEK